MKPDKLDRNELNEIAPLLSSLPKAHPFKVPDHYFDDLEGKLTKVFANFSANEEHVDFGTKKHPFTVPDGYFKNLPSLILQKIKSNQNDSFRRKLISIRSLQRYKLGTVAASFTILLAISVTLVVQNISERKSIALQSREIEFDISSPIENVSEVDEVMIVNLYSSTDKNNESDGYFLNEVNNIDPELINEL